jgi:hypothetical protein
MASAVLFLPAAPSILLLPAGRPFPWDGETTERSDVARSGRPICSEGNAAGGGPRGGEQDLMEAG